MSLTAILLIVSPDSSRTSAGPPTVTSPVYPPLLILDSDRTCRWPRLRSLFMDASGGAGASRSVGLPATEIAARVRAGELRAVAVVRAHLAPLEPVDAGVGAFRVVRTEAALREAAEVDARPDRSSLPLAG